MKTPIEMLTAIIEMQEANYGNGIKTHLDLIELAKEAKQVVKTFNTKKKQNIRR
jgi:hypothetical protein